MQAPRGERLIITLIGRRNVGKSSFINAITGQNIAIVDDFPGTTTDPVAKHYELIPIGPVTFYDTAGIDDIGEVGKKRVKATNNVLWRTDIAIIITDNGKLGEYEYKIIDKLEKSDIKFMIVFNKSDLLEIDKNSINFCKKKNINYISVSAKNRININEAKEMLISIIPDYAKKESVIVSDLIDEGDIILLVVPIDLAAPKGRLILPQVQVIREVLDADALAFTVKDRELEAAFDSLSRNPKLVIVDSQVVLRVSADVPDDIPLTTFSTLFARYKGDLDELVKGAKKVDDLKDGDKILISEGCSHHVQSDDIGRVKIPRWLTQYTGKNFDIDVFSGHDFPENLEEYALVIHCGACVLTGTEMKRRIRECKMRGVPITNYGVIISKLHGLLERVIAPFY